MTVTDQLKIIDNRIKSNEAQYDLGREAAKISALSSKNLLDKYEYLTGEDLGYKPNVFEKAKFRYSPFVMVLNNNTKSKTNKNKADHKNKQSKNVVYNSQHSFTKFKNILEFKEMPYYSLYKILSYFQKKFNKLDMVNLVTDENKFLKSKVSYDVGDTFKELYYIYRDKYNQEKMVGTQKANRNLTTKKLRLTH